MTEILVVVGFCIAQLALIEIPMLAFAVWPAATPRGIDRAKAWASAQARGVGVWALVVLAALLLVVGVIGILS